MPTTKSSFAKDPNFISFLLQQLSESFYKIKIQIQFSKFKNVQNPFNLKVAKHKIFSFLALYKFWNVLIVYYYVTYFKFFLYFMLAKEDVKCNMYICCNCYCIYFFFQKKKKKKKTDSSFSLGKNSKVMPQLPHYLSFLMGKGGKP